MTQRQQFQEVLDSAFNGQWTAAAEECVKYNLHAKDMIKQFEEIKEDFGSDPCNPLDLVHLAENAAILRCQK